MKHATKHTFSGMDSSGVDFYTSSHRDHAEVTFRDTNRRLIAVEGMRTALRKARSKLRSFARVSRRTRARVPRNSDLAKALKKDEVEEPRHLVTRYAGIRSAGFLPTDHACTKQQAELFARLCRAVNGDRFCYRVETLSRTLPFCDGFQLQPESNPRFTLFSFLHFR